MAFIDTRGFNFDDINELDNGKKMTPSLLTRMRQFAPLALVLLSAAVAVAAYLQALDYPFVSDDKTYITENTKLAGLRLTELWYLFTEPYNSMELLPLRDFSYWLDITLFGLTPSAFRVHNIILYLLCLPLVYGTTLSVWRYFRPADATSAPWAAAAVTALFALHPAHVEAVVWISGRKDVLSGMFSLFALWLAVRAKQKQGFSALLAAATLIALLAAMLSKATAVTVAPVIAMLWVIFWRDVPAPSRRYFLLLWPLAILFLAVCVTLIFTANSAAREPVYFGIEAVTRLLAVLGWLARLAVSPESRHFFHPVFEDPYLPAMVALGGVVLSSAVAGAAMMLRHRSLEGFALVAFLLLCMPYMQLIPYQSPSLVADRWLMFAVWPVILLLVALSWRLNPAPRAALLLAIAVPWGLQTMERPRDWHSFKGIIDADLRAYPGYYMPAWYKISSIQLPQGLVREASETAYSITAPEFQDIAVRAIETAYAVHVDAIVTNNPQKAMTLLWKLGYEMKRLPVQAKWNLPIKHFWAKRLFALSAEWQSLAEHFPDDVSVHYNAGLCMLNIPKYKYAVAHLRTATESQRLPESMRGTAFKNLGLALLRSGQVAEAETPLRAALEQSPPDLRAYCLLSKVYRQTKRFEEAAHAEASCTSLAPDKGTTQ